MHRRTLLRALAAAIPIGLAGCGGSGTDSQAGNRLTPTATPDFAPFEEGDLEVTYSRLDATSTGEAVAQLTVANAANETRSGALRVHFSTENGTASAVQVVEVPAGERKRFRIPLREPVDGLELTNFTFGPPT